MRRIVRRNADARFRNLQRAVEQGDVNAAQALLFEIARQGRWFLPRTWRSPGGDPPFANQINEARTYWVRLLGYLRWDKAAEFQAVIATQALPPTVSYTSSAGENVYREEPMHQLDTIGAFQNIGPEIAQKLGLEIMRVLAEAALREAFPITELDQDDFLESALRGLRELHDLLAGFQSAPRDKDEQAACRRDRGQIMGRLNVIIQMSRDHYWSSDSRNPDNWANMHAHKAFEGIVTASTWHRNDQPEKLSDVIFNATMAVGFACDARKGLEPAPPSSPWGGRRPRGDWNDVYGIRVSRGCMTVANRVIRKAQLEPALLAIASMVAGTT